MQTVDRFKIMPNNSGVISENDRMSKIQNSDVDRLSPGYQYYPQNPYNTELGSMMTMGNFYYPQYNNYDNGYGVKIPTDSRQSSYGGTGYGPGPSGYSDNGGRYASYGPPNTNYGSPQNYYTSDSTHQSYGPPPSTIMYQQQNHSGYPRRYKHKSAGNSAMSALTLLAFLFFLNILQNCLKEHMTTMNPTVMVMTAGVNRELIEKRSDEENVNDSRASDIDYKIFTKEKLDNDESSDETLMKNSVTLEKYPNETTVFKLNVSKKLFT